MSWFARLTSRRRPDNALRRIVQERETIARMMPGGAADGPIRVSSAAVVEARVGNLECPQYEGTYRVDDHAFAGPGARAVAVRCRVCSTPRTLWFELVPTAN